jgi:hypothetical protein
LRIFSEDTHKTTDREPIQTELCSFFVSIEHPSSWWESDSELLHSHTSEASGDEVSDLMDHDDDEEDSESEEDTEEDGHTSN